MYVYFKIIQTITEFDTFVQLISLKKLLQTLIIIILWWIHKRLLKTQIGSKFIKNSQIYLDFAFFVTYLPTNYYNSFNYIFAQFWIICDYSLRYEQLIMIFLGIVYTLYSEISYFYSSWNKIKSHILIHENTYRQYYNFKFNEYLK